MKIPATSVLHARPEQLEWIERACANADILLLAGDLLDCGEGQKEVINWLRRIPCLVAISTGNHDVMVEGPFWL